MSDEGTLVCTVEGEFEAQQVKAFLETHDIPTTFRGESLRKTHGFTLDGLGNVEVHAPAQLADRARELLARVESGEMALPDEIELEGS